jgi:hypothetical protein
MAHISSIGAGMYSDLSVCIDSTDNATAIATPTESNLKSCFLLETASGAAATPGTGAYRRITNVREFPAMGTPPNVVNVPVYGQSTSQQIQGQADAPSMEIQLNFIGDEWANAANYLGELVGDGNQYVFRFTLLNSDPVDAGGSYDSDVAGLGVTENSQYFWIGKMEALQVTPNLTDANTATVTITVQSDFFGAYTI